DRVGGSESNACGSKPLHLLLGLDGLYSQANPQAITERPREFDAECRAILRLLEIALRETYFHPSKVPASVAGEEGRGMPQQQQQQLGKSSSVNDSPPHLWGGASPGPRSS